MTTNINTIDDDLDAIHMNITNTKQTLNTEKQLLFEMKPLHFINNIEYACFQN
jgi:hypothetical protein